MDLHTRSLLGHIGKTDINKATLLEMIKVCFLFQKCVKTEVDPSTSAISLCLILRIVPVWNVAGQLRGASSSVLLLLAGQTPHGRMSGPAGRRVRGSPPMALRSRGPVSVWVVRVGSDNLRETRWRQ